MGPQTALDTPMAEEVTIDVVDPFIPPKAGDEEPQP